MPNNSDSIFSQAQKKLDEAYKLLEEAASMISNKGHDEVEAQCLQACYDVELVGMRLSSLTV